jgi:Ribosomal protein S1
MIKEEFLSGLKQTKPNPWAEFANKYSIGDKVEGNIKSVTDFGIFVGLEGDIDGLVHLSDIIDNDDEQDISLEEYKKDQLIKCIVFNIDAERERISLKLSE